MGLIFQPSLTPGKHSTTNPNLDTDLGAAPCCQSSLMDPQPHGHSSGSRSTLHRSRPDQHQRSQGGAASYNLSPYV